mgnify:CR=1 FL=1
MATLAGFDEDVNVTVANTELTDGALAITTGDMIFTPGTDGNWTTGSGTAIKFRMMDFKYTRPYMSSEGHPDSATEPTFATVFERNDGTIVTTTITARDDTAADTTIGTGNGAAADQKIRYVITGMEDHTTLVIKYHIVEGSNLTTERTLTITAADLTGTFEDLMNDSRFRERNRRMSMGSTALTAVAAKATLTFTGTATADQTITIVDTAGTSKVYTAKTSEDTAAREFNNSTSAAANATSLAACINASAGHGTSITAVVDGSPSGADDMIVLTQDVAGAAGNSTITNAVSVITEHDFDGGSDGEQFLDFDTYRRRLKKGLK